MNVSAWLRGKGIPAATAILCLFVSCSVGATVEILENRSQTPVFLGCKAVDKRTLHFKFSQAVEVLSFNSEPPLPVEEIEGGEMVRVCMSDDVPGGVPYTADMLVKDGGGNTLNVLIPFRSRNERMPKVLINELRTEYSRPRTEYVELKTLEAGNLGALRLFIPGNTKQPLIFEFPPVEVGAREYVVVYLRTLEETESSSAPPGGGDDAESPREFWVPGNEKLLHKTDVVYVMDQDDNIVDAVMMSENPDSWWTKDHFVEAADLLYREGEWLSVDEGIAGPADAVITFNIKTAATRSISRDEEVPDSNTAADWYVTATATKNPGATPGERNNPNRFEE
ncbi:MAG: hypothetical protein LBH51_07875 [Treponema sp.]|jgi:hypothetical protein|nr:hypothetical protein [Treponema sp.]